MLFSQLSGKTMSRVTSEYDLILQVTSRIFYRIVVIFLIKPANFIIFLYFSLFFLVFRFDFYFFILYIIREILVRM